jgi:hypothetical protein
VREGHEGAACDEDGVKQVEGDLAVLGEACNFGKGGVVVCVRRFTEERR